MKPIIKTIKVKAYKDKDGEPTCAADFPTGRVCEFFRTKTFGTFECCLFDLEVRLARRKNGDGSLIPLAVCPVWMDSEVDTAKALCAEIGCSKIGRSCDESPQDCEIVRKILGGKT